MRVKLGGVVLGLVGDGEEWEGGAVRSLVESGMDTELLEVFSVLLQW